MRSEDKLLSRSVLIGCITLVFIVFFVSQCTIKNYELKAESHNDLTLIEKCMMGCQKVYDVDSKEKCYDKCHEHETLRITKGCNEYVNRTDER